MTTILKVTTEITAAKWDAARGYAVKWGQPGRRFRQCLYFATREHADTFAEGLRAGTDLQTLLIGRALADRGRAAAAARTASLTPERRAQIGRKAIATRWKRVRAARRAEAAAAKAAGGES